MLAGQVISLGDSVIISLTGLMIVMLELAFLAIFIQIMSRLLAAIVKGGKNPSNSMNPVRGGKPLEAAESEEDEELAIIMATVLEETGWSLEEAAFRSIVRIQ